MVETAKNSNSHETWQRTYYVHDPQGNVLATYTSKIDDDVAYGGNNVFRLILDEQHLYGSSRLGIHKAEKELFTEEILGSPGTDIWNYTGSSVGHAYGNVAGNHCQQIRGKVRYELTDHLGNVRSVISDRKLPAQNGGGVDYSPDVVSAQDYYPFGMLMPGRQYANASFSSDYRYAFNGMERDGEVSGVGNSYTTYFRQLDSRLGKWFSRDPRTSEMPWQSPYISMDNNPVLNIDPYGDKVPTKVAQHAQNRKGDNLSWKYRRKLQRTYRREHGLVVKFESDGKDEKGVINGHLVMKRKTLFGRFRNISESAQGMMIEELRDDEISDVNYVFFTSDDNLKEQGLFYEDIGKSNPYFTDNREYSRYNGTSYFNMSAVGRNQRLLTNDYSVLQGRKARRSMNFGRVLEHETVHNITGYGDHVGNVKQFEFLEGPTEEIVNQFRREMGLKNYQRLIYRWQGQTLLGNPRKPWKRRILFNYQLSL